MTASDFEGCVAANQKRWMGTAMQFMPRQDAEDVVQETILKAWRALPQFKGESLLSSWMGRILQHLIYDRKRTVEGRAEHIPLWGEDDIALKFAPEEITRAVLAAEVFGLMRRTRLTVRERAGIENLLNPTQPDVSNMRNARHHGIVKLRCAMAR